MTTTPRETAADIFGGDAVLFESEADAGCIDGTDDPAPGAMLLVGEWADGDVGFVIQDPDGTSVTFNMPPDHARALAEALTTTLTA